MQDVESVPGANTVTLPSIDDGPPAEEGGPIARTGFNYQDEIAVSFLIEMLGDPSLIKIHCETHDDIVLVRESHGSQTRTAEYVQVKGSEKDQLWSPASLCAQASGKAGSSLYESSIGRDKHAETARFRVATLRPVVDALKPLTYPCGSVGREASNAKIVALKGELDGKFPDLCSPKGTGSDYWLEHCHWDVRHDELTVQKDNLLKLLQLAAKEGRPIFPDQADVVLQELRALAKAAGAAKWQPDPEVKKITRQALRTWWESRLAQLLDGASSSSGTKLSSKMSEASLPEQAIAMAIELRRGYAATIRADKYLQPDEATRLTRRVQSEMVSIQARYLAGQLDVSSAQFHSLCLDRMDAVNSELGANADHSAFLKGCMYDITDRCLLKFVRATT